MSAQSQSQPLLTSLWIGSTFSHLIVWIGLFESLASLFHKSSVSISDLLLVFQNGFFKVNVDAIIVVVSDH